MLAAAGAVGGALSWPARKPCHHDCTLWHAHTVLYEIRELGKENNIVYCTLVRECVRGTGL